MAVADAREKIVVLAKSPYETLDDGTREFLEYLKRIYVSCGSSQRVSETLKLFLNRSAQPYVDVLKVMYCCGSFHSSKAISLAVFIVNVFSEWLEEHKKQVEHLLEPYIKLDAMRLMLEQKNIGFRNAVIKAFDMVSEKQIFLPLIHELLAKKHYKDACETATALQLHEEFDPEDFLVPLYIQDKLVIIEEHVRTNDVALSKFIKFMDNLLSVEEEQFYEIMNRLDIRDIRPSKCAHKTLSKFLLRLVKTHKLPPTSCPHLTLRRQRALLHFLLSKLLNMQDVSEEGWEEMATDAVKGSINMQVELISAVFKQGMKNKALRIAQKVKLDKNLWPDELVKFSQSDTVDPDPDISEYTQNFCFGNQLAPLTLPFPDSHIILVDDAVPFVQFLENIDRMDIIGIDCEWKPSFGVYENELSLIQVATSTGVYILDRPALAQNIEDFSTAITDNFFHKKDLLKIGFGLSSDLRALKRSLHGLKQVQNLLDLSTLWEILRERYNFQFPHSSDPQTTPSKGKLKDLVEFTLGKELKKAEQFSDWERRPLRPEQLKYAAIDAHCLLQVYKELERCCKPQGIPFEDITRGLVHGRLEKQSPPSAPLPISACDVHVLCTWELWPLVTKLRQCGIDTVYINRRFPTKANLKLLNNGYKVLTTQGQPWLSSPNKAIMIPIVEAKLQLQKSLRDLNVEVLQQDIGTRCIECNSTEITPIDGERFRRLFKIVEESKCKVLAYNPEEEEDNCSSDFDMDDDYYYDDIQPSSSSADSPMPETRTKRGIVIKVDKMSQTDRENCEIVFICDECGAVEAATSLEHVLAS